MDSWKPILLGAFLCFIAMDQMTDAAPPSDHPYLFFDAGDIPALRERLATEPFSVRWEQFMARADAWLQQPPSNHPRWNLGAMGITAFAYAMTGEDRYARRAVAEALAAIDRGVWTAPGHRHFNRGADLVTAELCLGIALVYDWCHNALSIAEREILRDALINEGLSRYAISIAKETRDWWFEHRVNNWRGVSHGGMGVAALAVYHESSEARRLAEIARVQVPRIFDDVVLQDGGGHEGVGYHHYGITYAVTALMAQKRFHAEPVHQDVLAMMREKMAGYWDVYMQGPDLLYANIGRMGGDWGQGLWGKTGQTGGPNAELAALYESTVPGGDRLLLWSADNGSSRFYWQGASPFWFLWRRDDAPSQTGKPKPALQPAVLFRGAGHAVVQSDRLWLAHSGGRTHNRRDLGAFVLVVDKERFVHIPSSNRETETRDQSTVLVNGGGQRRDVQAPPYERFGSGDRFHYFALDLSGTYEDPSLTRFVRHVVMVDGSYLVILDDLAASKPAHFEARIQTELPKVTVNGNTGRIDGYAKNLLVLAAAEKEFHVTSGKGVLRFVSVATPSKTEEASLITVLYPANPGSEAPPTSFADGILRVGEGTLRFERQCGSWVLQSVNGEDASQVPNGAERNIVPFRQ